MASGVAGNGTLYWGFERNLRLFRARQVISSFGFIQRIVRSLGCDFGIMHVTMGRAVRDDSATALVIYAIFVFFQESGNLLVNSISAAFFSAGTDPREYAAGEYSRLEIFIECCLLLGALVICL